MVQLKYTILITAIGLIILLSGCVDKGANVPEETKPNAIAQTPVDQAPAGQTPTGQTPAEQTPAEQSPPYVIQVTEVKSLQDCIVSSGSKPCSIINLEIKNNNKNSASIKIIKDSIITKDGKQLGDRYDRDIGLSNLCVRQSGMEFTLTANADQNIGICYPPIDKSGTPSLVIDVMINGERNKYSFDLNKFTQS